jgi:hypothetical protein
MSESPAGASPRRRLSPVPPMPSARQPELILAELRDEDGAYGFWRILTDITLWCSAGTEDRDQLFSEQDVPALSLPLELQLAESAFRELWNPGDPSRAELAAACAAVWEWAESLGYAEVALQFAEAAARLDPETASRASTAGRLCRRKSERVRGTMWFRRAVRLARRSRKSRPRSISLSHI